MEYEKALDISSSFVEEIKSFCTKIEVCGSIRRKKDKVNDIDIVATTNNIFGLASKIKKISEKIELPKKDVSMDTQIFRAIYKGEQVDLYLTNKHNFEVIKLIRTGSAEHNVKLCRTAIKKGLRLNFAMGLIDSHKNLVDNTEEGILKQLLGEYIEPEERD